MSAGDPLHSVDPLHAEEVLQQVVQHPLAEREAQIDRLCGSDMALRTEVGLALPSLAAAWTGVVSARPASRLTQEKTVARVFNGFPRQQGASLKDARNPRNIRDLSGSYARCGKTLV